ncbi:fructose-6-phosphate aldolase [Terasakiella sp.]|uniref:fructose-6-phosphate aldolase n=1 Tax=unclassified Terasakiella TaxID=2614952 RepID=UPI003AA92C95
MKFFVDTADVTEIKELADVGLLDGVTTNPSLIAKSGRKFLDVVGEICDIVDGPVSAEVTAPDFDTMMKEAAVLRKIADNVAIKVPMTRDGIKTCKHLADDGCKVNVTLVFSAAQALLAAKAGAAFVSPFIGRLDDLGQDGMSLIEDIVEIYANYPDFQTEVLAASIRGPLHVVQAAQAGADVATVPAKALWQLFNHPLTDKGLEAFEADWAKTGQSIL